MRAGLIIGGLFVMFVGIFLFFTIIFTLFGIVCGFVGFIMLIVGLATSSEPKQIYYAQPSQPYYGPPQPQYQAPVNTAPAKYLIICPRCNNRIDSDVSFCPKCGADLRPKTIP